MRNILLITLLTITNVLLGNGLRTFRSADGSTSFEGRLIRVQWPTIVIERKDVPTPISTDFSKFSVGDIDYFKQFSNLNVRLTISQKSASPADFHKGPLGFLSFNANPEELKKIFKAESCLGDVPQRLNEYSFPVGDLRNAAVNHVEMESSVDLDLFIVTVVAIDNQLRILVPHVTKAKDPRKIDTRFRSYFYPEFAGFGTVAIHREAKTVVRIRATNPRVESFLWDSILLPIYGPRNEK